MQRVIHFPYEAQKVFLKDRYGNTRAQINLKQGENALETTQSGFYYESEEGLRFFVYEGEGVLDFGDCLLQIDFSELNPYEVDKTIFYGFYSLPVCINPALRIFMQIYEKNITKNARYLIPPRFLELESAILHRNS